MIKKILGWLSFGLFVYSLIGVVFALTILYFYDPYGTMGWFSAHEWVLTILFWPVWLLYLVFA
jgi:hypothetical protein